MTVENSNQIDVESIQVENVQPVVASSGSKFQVQAMYFDKDGKYNSTTQVMESSSTPRSWDVVSLGEAKKRIKDTLNDTYYVSEGNYFFDFKIVPAVGQSEVRAAIEALRLPFVCTKHGVDHKVGTKAWSNDIDHNSFKLEDFPVQKIFAQITLARQAEADKQAKEQEERTQRAIESAQAVLARPEFKVLTEAGAKFDPNYPTGTVILPGFPEREYDSAVRFRMYEITDKATYRTIGYEAQVSLNESFMTLPKIEVALKQLQQARDLAVRVEQARLVAVAQESVA